MARRVVVRRHGGPEVLEIEEYEPPAPGPGEAKIRHTAIGLNFIDVYFRTGLYRPPQGLPFTPGLEACGVVEEVGEGVDFLRPGQRVAYGTGPLGAYCDVRTMPAQYLVPIPDGIPDEVAAAMMLKGMTVRYLLRRTYEVKPGETILFHAAAGGVGLIACQWAKHLGATVIGTVGSDEKAEIARAHGCDFPINYTREDFVQRVVEITNGEKLPVVYDGVGRATFVKSLDCLRPLGLMVSFGNASGAVEPFDISILAQKGALFLTRPTLMVYTRTRELLLEHASDVIDVVRRGIVKIEIGQRFPLEQVAEAHRALESRRTVGATVLLP